MEPPGWIASSASLLAMTPVSFGLGREGDELCRAPSSMWGGVIYARRRHLCGTASSMRGSVIYAGRRHLCGAAPSMRGSVIYAGRRHLCGAASSMRGGAIYAGRRHLCGAAPSMRGSVIYAGRRHLCGAASSMRGGVIYAGQRHLCGAASSMRDSANLWRDSPMGPPGGSVALSRPRPAPRHAICVIASRPSEPSNERNHCRHPASASGRNHNAG